MARLFQPMDLVNTILELDVRGMEDYVNMKDGQLQTFSELLTDKLPHIYVCEDSDLFMNETAFAEVSISLISLHWQLAETLKKIDRMRDATHVSHKGICTEGRRAHDVLFDKMEREVMVQSFVGLSRVFFKGLDDIIHEWKTDLEPHWKEDRKIDDRKPKGKKEAGCFHLIRQASQNFPSSGISHFLPGRGNKKVENLNELNVLRNNAVHNEDERLSNPRKWYDPRRYSEKKLIDCFEIVKELFENLEQIQRSDEYAKKLEIKDRTLKKETLAIKFSLSDRSTKRRWWLWF